MMAMHLSVSFLFKFIHNSLGHDDNTTKYIDLFQSVLTLTCSLLQTLEVRESKDIYEIEKVLDRRDNAGTTEYRVKWKGYPGHGSLLRTCLAEAMI